jgi:hypothetical protein
MRMRGLIAMLVPLVWGQVSPAQSRQPVAAQQRSNPNARRPENPPNNPPKQPPNPAKELERFQKMSPEQRQKEMAKLRPAQRERMERLLERFENMPPSFGICAVCLPRNAANVCKVTRSNRAFRPKSGRFWTNPSRRGCGPDLE